MILISVDLPAPLSPTSATTSPGLRSSEKSWIAVLLAAGYGTRMGPLTRETAKPLLSVAGRPLIDRLMLQVSALREISAIHVVTNHRYFPGFQRWAKTWRDPLKVRGLDLEIHDDGSTDNGDRLGGAGDLGFLLSRIASPDGALVASWLVRRRCVVHCTPHHALAVPKRAQGS